MSFDSRTADIITGTVLLMLGIAMFTGGYTMDRLEIRQIHPASIPGLVPMGLGITMGICAVLLIFSARNRSEKHEKPVAAAIADAAVNTNTPADSISEDIDSAATNTEIPPAAGSFRNLVIATFLCVGYVVGLLGKMPFFVATTIYIFCFSLYFSWPEGGASGKAALKQIVLIALFSLIFAGGVSALFQYGFLVRLP